MKNLDNEITNYVKQNETELELFSLILVTPNTKYKIPTIKTMLDSSEVH